jgi:hypothetical protein
MKLLSSVLLLSLLSTIIPTGAFVSPKRPLPSSRLFGISQWRQATVKNSEDDSTRRLGLMNIPAHQVLLPGQVKYWQFTTTADVYLFQQAVDHCHNMLALGLWNEEGSLLDTALLLEIVDYNMLGGDFGIVLTTHVVGRAKIVQVQEADQYGALQVHVEERRDTSVTNQELASVMVGMIENLIVDTSDVEPESLVPDDCASTRLERFQEAYDTALEVLKPNDWNELIAMSWAAFSTSDSLANDSTFRLEALNMDCVTNRLKLAMYWLTDVRMEQMANR